MEAETVDEGGSRDGAEAGAPDAAELSDGNGGAEPERLCDAAEDGPAEDRPAERGPALLGPSPAATGNPGVDAALARLSAADRAPTEQHVAMYEDVHADLREALTALDRRPGPAGPAAPSPNLPNRS